LSASQQPTTLHGTVASPADCCDCYLTDTWSVCSWRWLAIAASPIPPEIEKETGYGASRTASHRGLSCHPLLFNIYISDLPTTVSRKCAYADDLVIMHADGDCQAVEEVLSKNMATVGEYLQTWKLKLSTTKTVSAVFHLNNNEAKRELKVNFNNEVLPLCPERK